MDMFKLVLNFFHNCYQRVLVKRESLSLVILLGRLCLDINSLKMRSATFSAITGSLVGRNPAILLNLSTTTRTPLCPASVGGNSVRKSIAMSSHGALGFSRGCNSPAGH